MSAGGGRRRSGAPKRGDVATFSRAALSAGSASETAAFASGVSGMPTAPELDPDGLDSAGLDSADGRDPSAVGMNSRYTAAAAVSSGRGGRSAADEAGTPTTAAVATTHRAERARM